nr:hypothetical protein BaRGS_026843 [Batillaria attramentaria]
MRKRDIFWFVVLILACLFVTFYFYFWLIAENDYNNLEWHMFQSLKKWIPWYTIMLGLACAAFGYFALMLMLSLCHLCYGHQLYIHPVHMVLFLLAMAGCITITVVIDDMWHEQWSTIYFSLQMMGPFLQIGAVAFATGLMWLVSHSWYSLSRKVWQLLWMLAIVIVMAGLYISPLFIHCPCLTFGSKLSPKPQIFAHRGAEGIAPENTVIAFEKAVEYGVYGLESDVRISYDGVPFIHHDDTLQRTTNVADVFPERAGDDCSMFNISDIQSLNAGKWFTEMDPFGTASELSSAEKELYENQSIPLLAQLMEIARNANMAVMFDVRIPSHDHPFFKSTVERVIDVVVKSGFNTSKLYWLVDGQEFEVAPPGSKMTYPGEPSLAKLKEANVSSVNVGFKILHPDTIREYRDNNISVNVWVVDSAWFFSYFWCLGTTSVTTRRIDQLAPLEHPEWTLPPNSYLILWVCVDVLSAVVIIIIFVIQRARSYRSRTMKEKLIRDGIIDPIDEHEGQGSGVVNQPAAYSMSSFPSAPFAGAAAVRVGPITQPDQKYEVE